MDASTATVPAASTSTLTATPLAASTVERRGTAVNVRRAMPLLYSPLTASTARIATIAWPNATPVRLTFAGSWPQLRSAHVTAVEAATPSATVTATTASSSH